MNSGSNENSFSHKNGWRVRLRVQSPLGVYVTYQLKKKLYAFNVRIDNDDNAKTLSVMTKKFKEPKCY